MEVQKITNANLNKIKARDEVAKESVSFSEVMSKGRKQQNYERLTGMMKEIEGQGKQLAESRTIDNLRKYKKLVKDFMEEAVSNGLQLEEQRGFNRRGRTKVYKIIKEVDSKLIELTNAVLDKEKKGLDALSLVGEIHGLLINIYT
ncbi:YaaR family protein [Cytobacillus sp. S13-E01]|uniref:YaaR family protein n=1 Tax=Cytobacillus sp. S13-E01 TaxID=3031326 RepID=UPI0023D7D8F3|nr:YaaR family protein [Cytobacillus sp. S13-E01]MDF0726068.1 YaaR family protein [Cytobacillus sp. S13-E01]